MIRGRGYGIGDRGWGIGWVEKWKNDIFKCADVDYHGTINIKQGSIEKTRIFKMLAGCFFVLKFCRTLYNSKFCSLSFQGSWYSKRPAPEILGEMCPNSGRQTKSVKFWTTQQHTVTSITSMDIQCNNQHQQQQLTIFLFHNHIIYVAQSILVYLL